MIWPAPITRRPSSASASRTIIAPSARPRRASTRAIARSARAEARDELGGNALGPLRLRVDVGPGRARGHEQRAVRGAREARGADAARTAHVLDPGLLDDLLAGQRGA